MGHKRHTAMLIFIIAATYVGTLIGAGFASGQEILVFFSQYGIASYISLLIAGSIFMSIGSKILLLGNKLKADSYGDMVEDVFGRLSVFINIYMFMAYMVISIAMFAGAGALFGEHQRLGVIITAILAAIVIINGIDGLVYVNAIVIPLLLIFNIIMFIYHIKIPLPMDLRVGISIPDVLVAIKESLKYASYNIILCIGVLVPLGNSIRRATVARWGGYMGGALIFLMLIASNHCLLLYAGKAHSHEMPLLYIAEGISPLFRKLYTFVLWGAIFTTLIANLYSIVSVIEARLPAYLHNISIIFSIIVLVILSKYGFSNIISTLYPILGILGGIFLLYIAIYPISSRR